MSWRHQISPARSRMVTNRQIYINLSIPMAIITDPLGNVFKEEVQTKK